MSATPPTYVKLTWEDPITNELQQPILAAPIAIGRSQEQMPTHLGEQPVSQLELADKQISRLHALITVVNQQLYVTDKSSNGTFLNGRLLKQSSQPFSSQDTLRIGSYKITATLVREGDENATELSREVATFSEPTHLTKKNSFVLWLVGASVLLAMSVGGWLLISTLLKHSRPQVPTAPQPSSSNINLLVEG